VGAQWGTGEPLNMESMDISSGETAGKSLTGNWTQEGWGWSLAL
jgi:hypothetical protein